MLPLDDPRWSTYLGGYRDPYDASRPLLDLLACDENPRLWDELWDELHHQGYVDSAAYAAVPWLVEVVRSSLKIDWNPLALIATIELARPKNPKIPPELIAGYFAGLRALPAALGNHPDDSWDETVTRFAVTCIALARGQRWYARACFDLDRGTAGRWFSEEFGWDFEPDD